MCDLICYVNYFALHVMLRYELFSVIDISAPIFALCDYATATMKFIKPSFK